MSLRGVPRSLLFLECRQNRADTRLVLVINAPVGHPRQLDDGRSRSRPQGVDDGLGLPRATCVRRPMGPTWTPRHRAPSATTSGPRALSLATPRRKFAIRWSRPHGLDFSRALPGEPKQGDDLIARVLRKLREHRGYLSQPERSIARHINRSPAHTNGLPSIRTAVKPWCAN